MAGEKLSEPVLRYALWLTDPVDAPTPEARGRVKYDAVSAGSVNAGALRSLERVWVGEAAMAAFGLMDKEAVELTVLQGRLGRPVQLSD